MIAACGSSPAAPSAVAPAPPPTPSPTTSLSGLILGTARNERVSGATVRIASGPAAGAMTTTSVDGEFRFDHLPLGPVSLAITAEHYQDNTLSVGTLTEGRPVSVNFYLRTLVVLTGIVVDSATGARIGGARVWHVDASPDAPRSAITDSRGVYRFEDFPAGAPASNFAAAAAGYVEARHSLNVNGIDTLNFELRPQR